MNEVQLAAFELRENDLKGWVQRGADLYGTLLAACSAHDPDPGAQRKVIRFLFRHGVSLDETDKNGVTPLHRAVRFRSPDAVSELIKLGAEVNVVDKRTRSSPLHRAVTHTGAPATSGKQDEAIEIAKILLSNGANPHMKNKNGKMPRDYVKDPVMAKLFSKSRK